MLSPDSWRLIEAVRGVPDASPVLPNLTGARPSFSAFMPSGSSKQQLASERSASTALPQL